MPRINNKMGMVYFPDTDHYRMDDINFWLPKLQSLGARWLVIRASVDLAVPESFIQTLINAGINPILHIQADFNNPPNPDELQILFSAYSHWGVKYISIFDRPNCRGGWSSAAWGMPDLVGRYLSIFLPLANSIVENGMSPVLSPLEPGGDYWDTAFFRAVLTKIQENEPALLDHLTVGVYAFVSGHPFEWGIGGPQWWPDSKPYYTPENSEDQCGFRIFDWYNAISEAVLNKRLPILLMGAGVKNKNPDYQNDFQVNTQIMEFITGAAQDKNQQDFPDNVVACNFWLLSAGEGSPELENAWFAEDGTSLRDLSALMTNPDSVVVEQTAQEDKNAAPKIALADGIISQYLLLPVYDWGISEELLIGIRPFIKKHLPTVGFSINEALKAKKLYLLKGDVYPPETVAMVKASGVEIDWIDAGGIDIAS
ncbi:MAG: hypothetical protein JXA19_04340 [Anaerolineales bacterium]|nr:hypothetical protein [Anaerolineales bacterium]